MIISGLLVLALATTSAGSPLSNLVVQPCDFGDAYQFSNAECHVELQNIGGVPIQLSNLRGTRPDDSLTGKSLVVPAHGVVLLDASVSIKNEEGISRFVFRFDTDEPGQKHRSAEIRGFVESVLDQQSPVIDFGVVEVEKLPLPKEISLGSRAVEHFEISRVVEKPEYIDVTIGKDRRTINVLLKPSAPIGPNERDVIKLSVNTPDQPQVWVKVKSDVHGDVVASSNPFAMGLMRTNNDNEAKIRLVSRSGKAFNVGDVVVEGIDAVANIEACIPESEGCKLLRLKISGEQPTGQVSGVVRLHLDAPNGVLPVYVWGMLLKPEIEVVDLNKEAERRGRGKGASVSSEPQKVDIKSALKLAIKEAEETVPLGSGPLIKWTATNEQLVFGYAIYRSTSPEGPFVRLNAKAIHTKNGDGSGSSYQWRDTTATKGGTYWYYVGLLNRDGSKQQLSTPQKVIAK